MLNLFGNKRRKIVIADKIWLSEESKLAACMRLAKDENNVLIATWFDETRDKLENYFTALGLSINKIVSVRGLARHHIENNRLIFAEHYPLLTKELELYEKLALSSVTVYSSLNEPLVTYFTGDKIRNLVKQMGMNEADSLENPVITSALKRAQKKIETMVTIEQSAHSQEDWFQKNLKHQ